LVVSHSVPTPPRVEHCHVRSIGRVAFDGYGAILGLRASDASLLAALRRLVPPGARECESTSVDATYSLVTVGGAEYDGNQICALYEDSRCLARSRDLAWLLRTLESEVHFTVAHRARTHLFVHAGVVGWRDAAILIPGRSY